MRTLLVAAIVSVLCGTLLWACSAASLESCSTSEECFGNETCIDGVCQVDDDADCVEHVGICDPQYCEPNRRECVECVRNDHCDGALVCNSEQNQCVCPSGTHECDGQCVDSNDIDHCGDRCHPCPDEWGSAATCHDGECGMECEPGFFECTGPGCETRCIQCVGHSDCSDPDRSRCYEGQCQGCAISDDCSEKPETPVCDQDTGTCIECSINESGACGGKSCDPATNECTDTDVRSLNYCDRCVADSECQDTQRCVPMYFAGQARPDGYCLDRESLTDCGRPLPIHLERVSLSGFPQSRYCGIREEKITCEAFHDFSDRCDGTDFDEQCGAPDLDDGRCTLFSGSGNAQYRCTYECTNDDDCHPGAFCTHPNNGFCLDTDSDFDD